MQSVPPGRRGRFGAGDQQHAGVLDRVPGAPRPGQHASVFTRANLRPAARCRGRLSERPGASAGNAGKIKLMSAKLIVTDLKKHYGAVEAVRGVSFDVAEGEIFGLLGPNGAGKTSAVECIIGLREPDGGSVQVCGIDALAEPQRVKQHIGVALQST